MTATPTILPRPIKPAGTRKRIMIICPSLGFGGAETQIIVTAKGLTARGHDVAIYLLSKEKDRVDEVRAAGVTLWEDSRNSRFDLPLLGRLRRAVHEWKPDLLHGYLFDGNLYARLAGLGNGIPVLSAERSSDYTLRRAQIAAHLATRWLSDAVVANSWAGAALARQMYPGLKNHIHVTWNGIDVREVQRRAAAATGMRATLGIPEQAKVACFVGTVKPEKDLLLAIETTRVLMQQKDTPWHVVFVGAPIYQFMSYASGGAAEVDSYAEQVEAAFATLPQQQNVHRLGNSKQVIELMAQSDVFFSTSSREGFPNVVLEAMTAGVPVVSTTYSDIQLILPLAWQVVAERNGQMMAAAILRAAEDRELAQIQKDWVSQHASIECAVDALEAVYELYIPKNTGLTA
ncbi:glycosyltransferase family 4 protein [Duganella qianjiadongensis]|uniref:Glycosyltransferase n=1 Tax=Duganella qianjiadongensis TaxID=2692176 RepID=A0ABW9VMK7_9BURK|nr:glycosyltransferase family 4 protein [Duganella qianjiadongensis]MYM40170.1 glycosyltransferase [Duganella qianjiadongensis]